LSRIYLIRDARGERRLHDGDLPLSIGGSQAADIVVVGPAADVVAAFVATSDGHAYVQPAVGAAPVYHNHVQIEDSAWLKSGDFIQVGETLVSWTVKGDHVLVDATAAAETAGEHFSPASSQAQPRSTARTHTDPPVVPASAVGQRRLLWRAVATGLALVVATAVYVLVAAPVAVSIDPPPDHMSVDGFLPAPELWGRYLLLPGSYTVRAGRQGYRPLRKRIRVSMGTRAEFRFDLRELPGRLSIQLEPAVAYHVFVDEREAAAAADGLWEVEHGRHRIRINTERYLPVDEEFEVAGFGKTQEIEFSLRPAWAEVSLITRPPGADVTVDKSSIGVTPLHAEVVRGRPTVVVSLVGYKSVTLHPEVRAGEKLNLGDIALTPVDGRLVVRSKPPGALLAVDGEFHGTTPATIALGSESEHRLRFAKPGFHAVERSLKLAPDEHRELQVELAPEYGIVFLTSHPADADLLIDGNPAGKATRRLRLTTRTHTLEIRKSGYTAHRIHVTPDATTARTLEVALLTNEQAKMAKIPATITTSSAQVLRLMRPSGPFSMGTSRREPGRRANESPRLVRITRAFYLAEKEVTNSEYRRFDPTHKSAMIDGASLDGDRQPVVDVSWDDAVRYCKWLSHKDGLPATKAYRLPTEAEWAYAARVSGRPAPIRYPWGNGYPPVARVGNFADARIGDTLADVVPDYDDGYRATAPVGSFAANPAGFYDMGGNVAEWIHDFYAVYPGQAGQVVRDPTGPATGEHHVVRDSSWRSGSITELRMSYRDYSRKKRADLGFRIARNAE